MFEPRQHDGRPVGVSRRGLLKGAVGASVALAAPASLAAACDSSTKSPGGPVELTLWHGWTDQWEQMVKDVVAAFHAKQSRVKIKPVVVPSADLVTKLQAAIAAKNPPDLVTFFGSSAIPALASQHALISFEEAGYDLGPAHEWYHPRIFELGRYADKTYGLSYWAGDFGLIYNKKHFREAGLDPEKGPANTSELDAMAAQLTKLKGSAIDRMGFLPVSAAATNEPWLWGAVFGGKFYDDAAKKVTADDPKIVEAMQWVQSYSNKYGGKQVSSFLQSLANERAGSQDPLLSGKYSMQIQGPWKLGDIKKFTGGFEYGVASPPGPAGSGNFTWGDITCIPQGSKDPKAAAEFIAFTGGVGDPAGYAQRCTWGQRPINVPNSQKVVSEPAFQAVLNNFPGFQQFVDAFYNSPSIGTFPVIPAQAYYADRLNATVQSIVLLQKQPAEAMAALSADVQAQAKRLGQ